MQRLSIAILLTTGFFGLSTALPAGENWPEFRGPAGDGHGDSAQPPLRWSESENIRWKAAIHGRGWSSPVVWGDQIWLTTATEDGKEMFAVCVDAASGEIVFDKLLIENEEPRFCHATNSYASCTPAIEDGRVYVHFGSYGTACLDTKTGETLWQRLDLSCDHFRGPGSSPILFENLLIVHYDGFDYQYVVAFDKETGKTIWKRDRNVDYGTDNGDLMKAYGTPQIIEAAGRKQLISPAAKAAMAYDPRTGEEIWRIRYDGHSTAARPLFAHGLLYISTGFPKGELYAVRPTGEGNVTDTHVEWTEKKSIGSKPSQLICGDLILNVQDSGVATCLDAETGEEQWSERLGGKFTASPVFAGGHAYFFDEDGKAYVIKPGRKFEQAAVNELEGGCMASPAVTGRALIVRTRTHLYRLERE